AQNDPDWSHGFPAFSRTADDRAGRWTGAVPWRGERLRPQTPAPNEGRTRCPSGAWAGSRLSQESWTQAGAASAASSAADRGSPGRPVHPLHRRPITNSGPARVVPFVAKITMHPRPVTAIPHIPHITGIFHDSRRFHATDMDPRKAAGMLQTLGNQAFAVPRGGLKTRFISDVSPVQIRHRSTRGRPGAHPAHHPDGPPTP